MSFLARVKMAAIAGYTAFMSGAVGSDDAKRRAYNSNRALAYYRNKMFNRDYADFTGYLAEAGLYQHTKLVFNPVPEIVNFYIDNLWQLPFNQEFPNLSTPATEETDAKILRAIAQLDQWSNWRTEANKVKMLAAASGNVLIEGHADFDRQKITQKTVRSEYVTDIQLNDAGDVVGYTLEYDVYDAVAKGNYRFKKVVEKEVTRYFKNDAPFAYGNLQAEEENKLGFAFAVWLRHTDDGSIEGVPAINNLDKVDHTNSLASHLHDNIHKEIESGKIIGIDDPSSIDVVSGASKNKDGTIREFDTRLERVILAGKGQVTVSDLSGTVKLAEAHPYLKELILSFADDYPELEYRQIMKESGVLSGVALERLLTPSQNRLDRAAANYDQQLIKLRQMQMTAGGVYLKDWTAPNDQQKIFSGFTLESYSRGLLDFQVKRSLLIEPTEDEREDLLTKKAARAVASAAFVDIRGQREIAGLSEKEIAELESRRANDLGVGE